MSPPETAKAGPSARAGSTENTAAAARQHDDEHPNRNGGPVRGHRANVLHRSFHSVVWTGSARVTAVLKHAVPHLSRDFDRADMAFIVYRSRVPALLEAFKAARVRVNELGGDR